MSILLWRDIQQKANSYCVEQITVRNILSDGANAIENVQYQRKMPRTFIEWSFRYVHRSSEAVVCELGQIDRKAWQSDKWYVYSTSLHVTILLADNHL